MTENLIILGSGPAGYTSAIYSARAGLRPLLVEGLQPGGQLTITTAVENYPGFPKGIDGPDLMLAMREQAERFGTRIVEGSVQSIELKKSPFKITVDSKEYACRALIIATGACARWLNIPGEKDLMGKGVSSCATCDGFFFKGQDVVVVGGGDTAIEEALYLAHVAKSVTVIHRRDELRATKAMQEAAKAEAKIKFLWNAIVMAVNEPAAGRVTSVTVKDVKTGKTCDVACSGFFVAVGHEPNTSVFKGKLKLDGNGYIVTTPGSTATSVNGVFAAGDVADPKYRQAATAVGTGCMAAIEAERWLAR